MMTMYTYIRISYSHGSPSIDKARKMVVGVAIDTMPPRIITTPPYMLVIIILVEGEEEEVHIVVIIIIISLMMEEGAAGAHPSISLKERPRSDSSYEPCILVGR